MIYSKAFNEVKIAPSLLAADLMSIRSEVASIEAAGADWLHVDVMDGHFVPNLSFGLPMIKQLKAMTKLPLDVHIMISNPDEMALKYVEAGADYLSFHVEAAVHAHRIVQEIHKGGARAGVTLNPATPLEAAYPLLADIDLVLLMSVNPGFGGQSFIRQTLGRIRELDQRLKSIGRRQEVLIEVDGGVDAKTAPQVIEAGADVLVAGTAVFAQADRVQAIKVLRQKG